MRESLGALAGFVIGIAICMSHVASTRSEKRAIEAAWRALQAEQSERRTVKQYETYERLQECLDANAQCADTLHWLVQQQAGCRRFLEIK